jgi:hypothetical protein
VPSQERARQLFETQEIAVPEQAPPEQASPQVQSSPSSQAAPVRHSKVPPSLVQRYCVAPQVAVAQSEPASQPRKVPPPHVPAAPFPPQPEQDRPTASPPGSHRSAQAPASLPQPDAAQVAWQHSLPAPASHAVSTGAQEHPSHTPAPSQCRSQAAA